MIKCIFKITMIISFSLLSAFFVTKGLWLSAGMIVLIVIWIGVSMYMDQRRIYRKMEYMISNIHYGDLNISLPEKGRGPEGDLNRAMNEALLAFRSRLYYSVVAETEVNAWQKLIRVLTHEIMNSIAPIISLAETVTDRATINGMNEKDYGIMLQAMQTIHRRSKGLLDFVENYRKLTRIPMPVFSRFPVATLFDGLKDLLPPEGKDITFEIRPPDLTLKADLNLLEQVILNLVKNAIEATPEGEEPVIRLSAYRKEGRPVITVSDQGSGIVPEALDKVFVPFFTTKAGGSGIGLSVCRQIMNRHGGTMTIESQPDKGTSVSLVFAPNRAEKI